MELANSEGVKSSVDGVKGSIHEQLTQAKLEGVKSSVGGVRLKVHEQLT